MRLLYFLILVIAGAILIPSVSAVENNQVNIYYFYSDSCPPCQEANAILNDVIKDRTNTNVIRISMDSPEGLKNYTDFRISFNIRESGYSIPFIVIGNDYYLGYTNTLKKDLIECIDKYHNGTIGSIADMAYENPDKITREWFRDIYMSNVYIPEDDTLHVYVFYTKYCPPCQDLVRFVSSRTWEGVNVHLFEVTSVNETEKLYAETMNNIFMNAFNIRSVSYPQIYIVDDYYEGFSESFWNGLLEEYKLQNKLYSQSNMVYDRYHTEINSYVISSVSFQKSKPTYEIEKSDVAAFSQSTDLSSTADVFDLSPLEFRYNWVANVFDMKESIIGWAFLLCALLILVYRRHK